MHPERRHIHQQKHADVDGSDHPMGRRALGQQQNSSTRNERGDRGRNMSGGRSLFHVHRDNQIITAKVISTVAGIRAVMPMSGNG